MVYFPENTPADDPESGTRSRSAESESIEWQIGELVIRHLRQSHVVRVWYDGGRIKARQSKFQNEREAATIPPAIASETDSERTEKNQQRASSSLLETQSTDQDSALSTDSETVAQKTNGISNVQNLTEKQAKAYLLLEQTSGQISISELAKRAGYSSKGGAYSAKEKWMESRTTGAGL